MFKWRARGVSAVFALCVGLGPTAGKGQEIEIVMALPAADADLQRRRSSPRTPGFYKQEGLKVTTATSSASARPTP